MGGPPPDASTAAADEWATVRGAAAAGVRSTLRA